ncbi:uncharacterized protein BDZ99DRAFT_468641 [Mytilinidion resinicola]|uniref:Uncharacterized protein n=1 Tax=Mytilinidion resinicola TaxID=574789 RepID=A0A6A6Y2X2_9PEZI|nr:uncharacterized protein BDZ99DRAFT_468641 [Mytilinidion resinicola]KAF2802989.1 hypothetical protein BDZ99DRAFT_468641 [Mytilinidion resinicola]
MADSTCGSLSEPNSHPPRINAGRSFSYAKGLLEIHTTNGDNVYEVLQRGGMTHVVAATNMKQESSCLYSIFVTTIQVKRQTMAPEIDWQRALTGRQDCRGRLRARESREHASATAVLGWTFQRMNGPE